MEVETLVDDLHKFKLREGHTDQCGAAFQCQSFPRLLFPQEQSVQDGKQHLRPDGLEQIIQCAHAIALIGKAGRGGEKDDLGGIIKTANLPRRRHAAGPGHHHIQQIQGKPLFSGGVQQLGGISEGLIPQCGFVLFLPDVQ